MSEDFAKEAREVIDFASGGVRRLSPAATSWLYSVCWAEYRKAARAEAERQIKDELA